MNRRDGFTLIELMIVVAIIAILAAVALPAYQDYVIRAKVTEGIVAASPIKHSVAEGFQTNGMTGVASAATAYSVGNGITKSKYISEVAIPGGGAPGEIRVTILATAGNGIPLGLNNTLLYFTPYVNVGGVPNLLGPGLTGSVDFGCQSMTGTQSIAQGMNGGTLGTLPAKYAPSQCR